MNITEQKILNGIKFFLAKTDNVGRTKLFKLLFFWDFINFKRFGKTVTGYDYLTYPFGPVPERLYKQLIKAELPESIEENFIIELEDDEDDSGYKSFSIKAKDKTVDFDWLTPNEKSTLEDVAFIFKDTTAKEMSEISHLPKKPWDETVKSKGMFKIIDYLLALDEESPFTLEEAKERLQLQRDLLADGRL